MKLMDKIKNLFLDEDEYEVEEEELPQYDKKVVKQKQESKEPSKDELPKVMRDIIKEEEKMMIDVENPSKLDKIMDEKSESNNNKKFNFPIDFENDFVDTKSRNISNEIEKKENNYGGNFNVLKLEKQAVQKVSELYPKKEEENIKPKFKASPVISPVYGVLDKNYTKEEVKEKSEEMVEMKRPSKKVDFETVRKKAFGNLADDIKDNLFCENCELYKEVKKISSLKEDDLLYDMTVEEGKEVTIERAYDNYEEFGVAYEPRTRYKDRDNDDLLPKKEDIQGIINKDVDHNEDNISDDKIENIEELIDDKSNEDEIKDELPSREHKKKETKVDADFFELIDSMYKERVDE